MAWPIDEFTITDPTTGLEQIVSVSLPARLASLDEVPLLVCLDGPWMFGTVRDATRIMSMGGEAPEAAVVGLSFADPSMGEYLRQRARWYTPTPWVPPEITGVRGLEADECGRAAELLSIITDQVVPRVEAEHLGGTPVSQRWLIGHSFSALFGLRALFTEPTAFDRWLLASPSIWWDDRSVLADVEAWFEANDDLEASLFLCYGSQESQEPPETNFRMGANVDELVEELRARAYPGLDLHTRVLPDDGHSSSIGAAVSHGLRALT